MEPQVTSAALSFSEAIATSGFVAIAVGINKKAKAGDFNPSLAAYRDILSDPAYSLLLDTSFLTKYNVRYNIQVQENDNGATIWSYFGFIAQHKTAGNYVIVFRGTQNDFEYAADKQIALVQFNEIYNKTGLVAKGFYSIFQSGRIVLPGDNTFNPVSLSQVAADPQKYMPTTGGPKKITVTGHSLGAAVATYFAAAAAFKLEKYLSLDTFASPMTGDKTFTAFATGKIGESNRIYNEEDSVPKLPVLPDLKGNNIYTHVIGGFRIDSTNNSNVNHDPKTGRACAHQLPVYRYLLEQLNGNDDPNIISAGGDARCRIQ
ncbi:lipase family protein [Chitinophaga nivalis]|uniref:Fungal lipase-type domain-containing protein n=1 Tax=Chitinophaga nivalis TaxID=2991709 RepID=A0ABT3IHV5_9BACT|nr:hypothetical protein [Chitinophaga nivalis]MCW3466970.1 hypothetical protein [Chitinophaga nivalis]MCW3483339.1 hypothetical protein [Chitinophaga nivalis]